MNNETIQALDYIEQDWRLSERIALITCDYFGSFEDLDKITELLATKIRGLFRDMLPDDMEDNFFINVINDTFKAIDFKTIARGFVEAENECYLSMGGE